jgi:N-methylhydantoinase A
MKIRVAVDVGGTFTDVVKLVPETGELRFEKVLTTPEEPTRGVLNAFESADAKPEDVSIFNHGTTLGLNSLLTRTGARTAIISTRGFRDVYLLGRTDRRTMYDIKYKKPVALVQRYDTFEVTERSYFDGTIGQALDETDARTVGNEIARRGYQSVAIAFLHSYVNPAHELRMGEILREIAPEIEVSLSHELSREYREYERTSTAVLDAYIKPKMRSYLRDLDGQLINRGFTGRFLMTRSGGGAMTAAAARDQPVNLILSGPAGGVIGAAAFSRMIDRPNLITVDMGGTSLDASLVLDHEPVLYQGAEFEHLPINTTSLNIQTIGAGGGSIATIDDGGALQVGPQSAGANPGPAAYGRGGTAPTFTDAALVLGYLGTDTPLGGTLTLIAADAEQALEPLAKTLGLSTRSLARGIIRISTTKIMGAVRAITVELGLDPKDFALLAFGGGGGLVAVDVARELGIPTVIIPPGQGAFSALGMLMADVQHDFGRTFVTPLDGVDHQVITDLFDEMATDASATLQREGFDLSSQHVVCTIDVRYTGQEHSVTVRSPSQIGVNFAGEVREQFEELHARQYGHIMTDPIEITTLRLAAIGTVDKPSLPKVETRDGGPLPQPGSRPVYVTSDQGETYALFAREDLKRGDTLTGPAVITEHTATTVMHAGEILEIGAYGEMVITIGWAERGSAL